MCPESVIRMVGVLLDEMIATNRRYVVAGSATTLLDDPDRLPSCRQHPAPGNQRTVLHHTAGPDPPRRSPRDARCGRALPARP